MPGRGRPYLCAYRERETAVSRRLRALLRRLKDPRAINPIYVFAGGLTLVVPIWLLFLKS